MADDYLLDMETLGGASDGYNNWRLRGLSEEAADKVTTELNAHGRAFNSIKNLVDSGDLANAASGLSEMSERIGKTAVRLAKTAGTFVERKGVSAKAQRMLGEMIDDADLNGRERQLQALYALRDELIGK